MVFVSDVDAEYSGISRKGVHFINPPKTLPDGWRTAHFEDPDQNLWEIVQLGFAKRLTACITGGWGEKGLETGNCYRSEPTPKNAPSPSRLVHAVLGGMHMSYAQPSQFLRAIGRSS